MERKIKIRELHTVASQMKYSDFQAWVAKELFDTPDTIDSEHLTDLLCLGYNKYPHPNCDASCFYQCSKGCSQIPECITNKKL